MTYKEARDIIDKQAKCVMTYSSDGCCDRHCGQCELNNSVHELIVAYAIVLGMLDRKLKEDE